MIMFEHIPYANRQEWLQLRQTGIGGSDVSAIIGLNPYKTPVQVFLEKVSPVAEHDDNEAMFWGRKLEPLLLSVFEERTGLSVTKPQCLYRSRQYPFMLASLDAEGVDADGRPFVVECKTASAHMKHLWEDGGIPVYYVVQLLHYLIVTGYAYGYFAVLIGGNDFRIQRVERDAELEQMLCERERDFWEQAVMAGNMPAVDAADEKTLLQMFPEATDDAVELAPENVLHLERREELRQDIKRLETELSGIDALLKSRLQDHAIGECGPYLVKWTNMTRNAFDVSAFQKQYPDIYQTYCKPSTTRRFTVSQRRN